MSDEANVLDGQVETTTTDDVVIEPTAEPEKEFAPYLKDIELDADLKSDPSLQDFKSVGDVLKSYIHAKRLVGADKVVIPNDKSSKEDWTNVFRKLGVPAELEKYEVSLSEGSKIEKEFFDGFKSKAHELGILPRQAKELLGFLDTTVDSAGQKRLDESNSKAKSELESLQTEWGKAYDVNVKKANYALSKFADPELVKHLADTGLANNAYLIKMLAKVGGDMAEDNFVDGTLQVRTPDAAITEMNKVRGDKTHAYYNSQDPGHTDALKLMEELAKEAYPENK